MDRVLDEAAVGGQPVEDVGADLGHAHEAYAPDLAEPRHVKVGRVADLRHDEAAEGARGHRLGPAPGGGLARPVHGAVADEAELADVRLGALIDHPADALRIAASANAVQHHLGDGRLAGQAFAAGLVIDRVGEAAEFARALEGCRGRKMEGEGRGHGTGKARAQHEALAGGRVGGCGAAGKGQGRACTPAGSFGDGRIRALRQRQGAGRHRGFLRLQGGLGKAACRSGGKAGRTGVGGRRPGGPAGQIGGAQECAKGCADERSAGQGARVDARSVFNRQNFRVLFGEGGPPPDIDALRTELCYSKPCGAEARPVHDLGRRPS